MTSLPLYFLGLLKKANYGSNIYVSPLMGLHQTVLEHSSEDQPSPANQREPWLPRD